MKTRSPHTRAFTPVDLILVVAVLGLLAALAVRAQEDAQRRSERMQCMSNLDVDERQPQMILSGDRNLTNGIAPKKGILELTDATPAGWTDVMHVESGNVGLVDGSAQHLSIIGLRRQISAANQTSKLGMTRLQLPVAPKP